MKELHEGIGHLIAQPDVPLVLLEQVLAVGDEEEVGLDDKAKAKRAHRQEGVHVVGACGVRGAVLLEREGDRGEARVVEPERDAPVRELCTNQVGLNMFMSSLYKACENSGQFGKGKVPAILVKEGKRIRMGKGETVEISFEIKSWVDRPDELDNNVDVVDSSDHQKSTDDQFDEAI